MKIRFTLKKIFALLRQSVLTWCEGWRTIVLCLHPVNVLAPVPKSIYKGNNVYVIKYSFNGETRYYLENEVYPWTDSPDNASQYYSMLDASGVMQDFIDEWNVPLTRLKVESIYEARRQHNGAKEGIKPPVRISHNGKWVEISCDDFIELMQEAGTCTAFDRINERFHFIDD